MTDATQYSTLTLACLGRVLTSGKLQMMLAHVTKEGTEWKLLPEHKGGLWDLSKSLRLLAAGHVYEFQGTDSGGGALSIVGSSARIVGQLPPSQVREFQARDGATITEFERQRQAKSATFVAEHTKALQEQYRKLPYGLRAAYLAQIIEAVTR